MSDFELATIVPMIGLNAVFAAYEIALASVPMARLQALAKYEQPVIRAALFMKKNMEASFATVLLGITLVGAVAAVTGGAGAEQSIVPYLQDRFGWSENVSEIDALGLVVLPLSAVTIVVHRVTRAPQYS